MALNVYLSGEIHTDWRERIERGAAEAGLEVEFGAPVTDHAASDNADKGGFAGSRPVGEPENFRCAFDKKQGVVVGEGPAG